ncbi:MAG: cytochrome c oxidase subunit 3 [Ginsengibacter sp.]
MKEKKEKLHPLKYNLWVGLASIVMMFAAFSSAFIIKRSQGNWISFDLPLIFWYSTGVMILSSITIILSRKAFQNREMGAYIKWLITTLVLGLLFILMQYIGFTQLWDRGITLTRNVAFSFLYVIVGLHALHVLGGIVAMLFVFGKALNRKQKMYTSTPIDLMNTYWHFVDLLWIYLLIFLVMVK